MNDIWKNLPIELVNKIINYSRNEISLAMKIDIKMFYALKYIKKHKISMTGDCFIRLKIYNIINEI